LLGKHPSAFQCRRNVDKVCVQSLESTPKGTIVHMRVTNSSSIQEAEA